MPANFPRLFATLLCASAVTIAAPKKPVAKSVEARGDLELKAMVAAYASLDGFTFSCEDNVSENGVKYVVHSVSSLAADDRQSIRATMHSDKLKSGDLTMATLYDGVQLKKKLPSATERVLNAAQLKAEPQQLPNFFGPSVGSHILAAILKRLGAEKEMEEERIGAPVFHDLGGGKSSLDLHFRAKSGQAKGVKAKRASELQSIVIYLGADKFLQRVEVKAAREGSSKLSFYSNSYLTKPKKLDTLTAFDWKLLSSSEPEIVGQSGEIPPIVPETGKIPGAAN